MLLLKVETDARTVKCYIDHKLDDHSFVKSIPHICHFFYTVKFFGE